VSGQNSCTLKHYDYKRITSPTANVFIKIYANVSRYRIPTVFAHLRLDSMSTLT